MANPIFLTINGWEVQAAEGVTILQAAQQVNIYIPALCAHPDLPPAPGLTGQPAIYRGGSPIPSDEVGKGFEGCQLCLVEIEGREGFFTACSTLVSQGMVIRTDTPRLKEIRQDKLMNILASHPHACLTCAEREGCAREPCSLKVEVNARCCPKFGRCELQKISEYIGIKKETPRYTFRDLPLERDEPLFLKDYNLCIGCLLCVRVCHDLRGVGALGFIYRDGGVLVGTVAPSLKASACRFCGACVEVCPTGALRDKGVEWAERQKALIPCTSTCPAGVDVPRYVRLISQRQFAEAAAVVRERLPLPLIVSYVCPHPCEEKCRRAEVNEPVAICRLKRFTTERDTGLWQTKVKVSPPTGKRVAVVGSGPAGLTVAYYLSGLGHSVTVLEALPQAGGMMRVGIPPYRLPRRILDQEIEELVQQGVIIHTNTRVESLEELFQQGYNAIFLALGAHRGIGLGVEGQESPGVVEAITLLRQVGLGQDVKVGQKVAVIGGGDAAIDAARVSLRLGAKEVNLVYRRTRAEMPAHPEEVEQAEHEGVKMLFLASPTRISQQNGRLKMECLRQKLVAVDASGRPRPEPISGSEFAMEFDTIIQAVGQMPQVPAKFDLRLTTRHTLEVNTTTLATPHPGVFAGGDCVTGPATVVEAIAQGRLAAISIDKFLGGEGAIQETLLEEAKPNPWLGRDEGFAYKPRSQMPCLTVAERLKGFSAVELGFPEEAAVAESGRCLQCDLRLHISSVAAPPDRVAWLGFTRENVEATPEMSGVYQLLDEDRGVIYIAGVVNLRQDLRGKLEAGQPPWNKSRYFVYEQNDLYTAKESELLQQFVQEHGQMPTGNEELLDLF